MSLFLEIFGALLDFADFSEFFVALLRVLWPLLASLLLYGVCASVWFVHGPSFTVLNCNINIAGAILGTTFMLAVIGYYNAKN